MRDPVLLAAFTSALLMLLFNYLQGYYQPRLQMGLLLIVVLATARLLLLLPWRIGAIGYLCAVSAAQLLLVAAEPAISQN